MFVYAIFRATLWADFDSSLRTTVQALAALAEETEAGVEFGWTPDGLEEFVRHERPSYFQVWHDGRVLAKSSRLRGSDLGQRRGSLTRPGFHFTTFPDGRHGRVASATFQPRSDLDEDDPVDPSRLELSMGSPGEDEESAGLDHSRFAVRERSGFGQMEPQFEGNQSGAAPLSGVRTLVWERPVPTVTIAVARDTSDIDQRLAIVRWTLVAGGLTATGLSVGLLMYAVRRGLRPLHSISQAISRIDAGTLGSRVDATNVPTEIESIVQRLNELLTRLEEAFHRERAFSSDLAHELRTPLAGLRLTLEVYLSRPHQSHEYRHGIQACLEICDQADRLVANLLALARLEGKHVLPSGEMVLVDQLFRECWHAVDDEADARGLHAILRLQPDAQLVTDREMLRVILRNLIDNAVSHCDSGGSIEARVETNDRFVSIQLTNTGNRLTAKQASHVFERLWRGDGARTASGQHFGLGLTLCQRLSQALGGSIEAHVDGNEFRIQLSFPASGNTPCHDSAQRITDDEAGNGRGRCHARRNNDRPWPASSEHPLAGRTS
jgi:signal transduction histidine kinase